MQGSVIIWQEQNVQKKVREDGTPVFRTVSEPTILHVDIIRDEFWEVHGSILAC